MYEAWWRWDRHEYEKQWADGTLLDRHGPHSPALYYYGCWVIRNKKMGYEIEVRKP